MSAFAGPERPSGTVRETPDIETASPGYARRFGGEVGTWFLEVQQQIVSELLQDLPPGSQVLDVGGGHGQLARPLTDAGHHVTVTGSAPSCASRIRPLLDTGRIRFLTCDLLDLPIPDDAFDAVVAFRLLPHLEAWREFVGELCRVSAGPVVVDYPSRRSFNFLADLLFGLKKRIEGDTRPYGIFAPGSVEEAFSYEGYRIEVERREFVLPMALYRALDSRSFGEVMEAALVRVGLRGRFGSPVVARAVPAS